MGKRKIFFTISGVLVALSIVVLLTKGLTFGIEFQGGTKMVLVGKEGVSVEDVRDALGVAEVPDHTNATIQSTNQGTFIVRTAESDTANAQIAFDTVVEELGLPEQNPNITTIGPSWGENVTRAALIALIVSMAAILLYISVRFEYKMSVTAVVAVLHDAIITLGIYSLSGRELTPNTIAALLTILGYSLYDTIVVFHRIRENTPRLSKQSFMSMANDSLNQVLMRWVNTSLSSLIPASVLLFFGGETLKDFAFALLIGLMSGAYSSVAVASPLYAVWKETEPRYQALKKKYAKA